MAVHMDKYIEKYWHNPKFYRIHLYLCFIFAFLGLLVFGFAYFYASFDRIRETGFYLLCLYSFSFCACSGFLIVAASQKNEKDLQERKDVIKGCWMWLSGFLPIVAGMTLWILYESSGYVLDYKLVVKPSPELTRELEFLTGKTFEDGFFDYSLDEQTVDLKLTNMTASSALLGIVDPRFERDEKDIRNYRYEAVIRKDNNEEKVLLDVDWDTARFVGTAPNHGIDVFDRGTCHVVADFTPDLTNVVEVLGNGENPKEYQKNLGEIPTFSAKAQKLYINTRDIGDSWTSFCAEQFKLSQPLTLERLPSLHYTAIFGLNVSKLNILSILLPTLHKDIINYYPTKRFVLNFSLENFGRWI